MKNCSLKQISILKFQISMYNFIIEIEFLLGIKFIIDINLLQ